jgi:1-deoxy-D-xylulose-5-phosphate synthase
LSILERVNCSADVKALSMDELNALCREIRSFLIGSVSKTGGHLASNLGVVELTVAIHNVFDTEKDRLVFDVGHQCYVHKLLTGRREAFDTLRQEGGLSGYPKPSESASDAFIAGHASNSISVALGMARARSLSKADYSVVVLAGDGALTGGLAFEGLNNAGQSGEPLIIILNDNGMAIDNTVGSLSKILAYERTRPAYYELKKRYRKVMNRLPGGKAIYNYTRRIKNRLKRALLHSGIFEELGFRYLGPVDGHDVKKLSYMLKVARDYNEPVLLHVVTQKGKGYPYAELLPDEYHGVAPFDPLVGLNCSGGLCFSKAFGDALCELAASNPKICAVTAAMKSGTGLDRFAEIFRDRYFDEGIAEGHCVAMAAGMAAQGLLPVFAVYSTFLQRGYDMLIHDVALMKLHVVLAVDRAGFVGGDGETHNGVFDVGYLTQIPHLTVYSPSSYRELADMLKAALDMDGPVAVRYPRGEEGAYAEGGAEPVKIVREGSDVTIVSYGIMINEAIKAADLLKIKGVSAEVVKLGRLAPLELEEIRLSAGKTGRLIIAEDCVSSGCMGEKIAALLDLSGIKLRLVNIGGSFTGAGTVAQQMRSCGIDAESIARRALELVGSARQALPL